MIKRVFVLAAIAAAALVGAAQAQDQSVIYQFRCEQHEPALISNFDNQQACDDFQAAHRQETGHAGDCGVVSF